MVLIGLLLVALVCLILGLVLTSAGWLVGALAATALAAWVLWRGRDQLAPASGDQSAAEASTDGAVVAVAARPGHARRPADALGAGTHTAQDESGQTVGSVVAEAPDTEAAVRVVDGHPHYHRVGCGALLGLGSEAVPYEQAVADGFTPCPLCAAASATASATASSAVSTVWVADGWPHYHDPDCSVLASSGRPESVPLAQALADGFTPCPDCRAAASVAEALPARPRVAEVWVVDGRPRYHLADCMIIDEQRAHRIPLADAANDGFKPCSLCEPPRCEPPA